MGAEIRGVDAARATEGQFQELRQALFRNKMIYLRQQKLTHGEQEAFSLRFGPFAEDAYTQRVPGHRNAVEAGDSPIGRLAATRDAGRLSDALLRKIRGNAHPMARTHPVPGEKALYVDSSYGIGIEGMLPEASAPILNFLTEHLTQTAFTCRLRWEPNTLTMWDNRLCVHQAHNDYQGYRRELYRTTVSGETPV